MKRIIKLALSALALMVAFTGCQKPDGFCELKSFDLRQADNSTLTADIKGVIDASSKTITMTIPTSAGTSFIPSFTVTEYDVVTIGGVSAESGVTSVTISDGTKVTVTDEVSEMSYDYTITVIPNDGEAELLSVVFKKADNELLKEDVAPEAIASEMLVRVPGAAFQKELVLTVTGGQNDVVSVNGAAVSGSVKVDTSFPIDITVSDAGANVTNSYVLKVGKILEVVVSKVATYKEGTLGSDVNLAVNPVDGVPYIAYVRKVDGDASNMMSVARLDGSAFSIVGKSGFNGAAKAASKPQIAFAADGTLYAKYLGGEVSSRPSVRKYSSEWDLIGDGGFTSVNVNTSYPFPFFVNPANSQPSLYFNGNTKNQPSYRTINFASYAGGWSQNVVTGTVPAYGSGSTASSGMYYGSSLTQTGGKAYIGSSFNEFGYYVHEVASDGTLKTIVDNYIPSGEKCGLPGSITLKAAADGTLYFMGTIWTKNIMQIWKVADGSFTAYGEGMPVTISSSGGVAEDVAFGIGANNLFVSVSDGTGNVPVFQYLNEAYQWVKFTTEAPEAKSAYSMDVDKDGNLYVAYISKDGNIEVYKIGLEADIIPE